MTRRSIPLRCAASSAVLVVCAAAIVIHAQQPPPPAQADGQRFESGTTAVMVDVVVRDKQGKPVTDLTASDFEIYEDGVRQAVGAMTMVAPGRMEQSGQSAASTASGAAGHASAPASVPPVRGNAIETPTFVALVFDRLTPEARALAYKGALAHLDTSTAGDFAGVFLIDQSLATIQTYTNDRTRLRTAIEEAASRATSGHGRDSVRARALDPQTAPTAGADSAGPAFGMYSGISDPNRQLSTHELIAQLAGGDPAEALALRIASRMEQSYETMMREQEGYATTNGLFAIVDSLGLLPGRKTVVFFAEGLAIPPNVLPRFDAVVAMANRSNVSVYTIDAAGLRVHSTQAATSREVGSLAADNSEKSLLPDNGEGAWLKGLEQNEDALRKDPNVSLRMLAERTGGFLLNNTNDLQGAFHTIDADRRFHYLLTYAPTNADFNGEWRNVTVKVPTRDVRVRARTGYLAVRALNAVPVLSWEAPAVAALERTPRPADLPLRVGAFVFPTREGPATVAVIAALDSAAVAVAKDANATAFHTEFTILARLKNQAGDIVRKASQPYQIDGPLGELEKMQRGEVIFFRKPTLPAGSYTLEAVAHDAVGHKDGVASRTVNVPDVKPGQLAVSSLLIVRRTERVPPGEKNSDNPLYVGDLLLYPNLGEPLRKSTDKTLSFYLSVQPGAGLAPGATLELLHNGKPLAQAPLQLAAAGADGRIQHTAQLPLANFPPGEYGLRISVTQGSAKEVRDASFTVIE